ncbi:MAG: hypothetical protein PHE10_11115 [Kiritimatiellae bacterium]|nr:hypothetical protein [Kiritimatiellia bacterium]
MCPEKVAGSRVTATPEPGSGGMESWAVSASPGAALCGRAARPSAKGSAPSALLSARAAAYRAPLVWVAVKKSPPGPNVTAGVQRTRYSGFGERRKPGAPEAERRKEIDSNCADPASARRLSPGGEADAAA